jgi:hypothetical protein
VKRSAPGVALALFVLLAGCAGSPKGAGPATTEAPTSTSTTTAPTTTSAASEAPAVYPTTYTDSPEGQPGYALVVNPGPAGSGSLGGVAVFQYQDGKEAGYFSFSGRAVSSAPFTLSIKGDPAATTATAQLTSASTTETASTITIENCDRLFSPAVVNGADGEADPPAPMSCTFSYKLAPGPARPTQSGATNLTATAAINRGLVTTYLAQHGWQTTYGSDISLVPESTYLAYDPQTGLDWADARFTYKGPETDTSNSPDVAMQDGGEIGIFYRIPVAGALPSAGDGWVMLGVIGEPPCWSRSIVPLSVIGLWGLVDPPDCSS